MNKLKKVKLGDICKIIKGSTGIASAEPGEYPLVVTAVERKTCSTYQFDCEAVCIPLVSSSGHGKKSLNNVHYQKGKFALGSILCAVIPNNPEEVSAAYLHQYLQFYKDTVLVPLMKGAANVSLSMRDIATLEIPLPDFKTQSELAKMFVEMQNKQKEINAEFEKQSAYAKQLRQNILQDAIEGKLTADLPCRQAGWRKKFKNLSGKIVPKQSCKYFAYVLECDDGSLYKGYSENLYERINRHLEGRGSEWTQKHKPTSLIHFEEFETEKEALEREKYFKSGSGREWLNEIRNKNKLDFDAEALFEEIQKERVISSGVEKSKKQKELAPIGEDDLPAGKAGKPFEIPEGWKWVKIEQVTISIGNKNNQILTKEVKEYGKFPAVSQGQNLIDGYSDDESKVISDLPLIMFGDHTRNVKFIDFPFVINADGTKFFKSIICSPKYCYYSVCFLSKRIRNRGYARHYSLLKEQRFPLPPLKEQEEIVNKVEKLLNNVVELEQQISQREEYAKKLMQSVLRDAFARR